MFGVRRSISGFRAAASASVLALCLGASSAGAGALSADDEHLYKLAFDSAHKQHFDWALSATHKAHNKLLAKVLEWQYYVTASSGAEFGEITAFMRANPDWPQQATLERRAEEAITAATPKSLLIDVAALDHAYLTRKPDLSDPAQLVSFGTSGHRGTPLRGNSVTAQTENGLVSKPDPEWADSANGKPATDMRMVRRLHIQSQSPFEQMRLVH